MTDQAKISRRRTRIRRPAIIASLLALSGCTPAGLLTQFDRVVTAGSARRAVRGEAYGSDQRQKLDVWVPARRAGTEALPVVVFFYGGGWNAGSRGDYGFAGAAFAGQQFVAVVPDYRLVPEVRFPAFVEDGALAARWARDNAARFGGDPNRITIVVHSAGAYIGSMLALDTRYLKRVGVDPRSIKAAALLSGPYDFYPFTESRGQNAFRAWATPRDTQPINFARRDAPPMLLLHGGRDQVVLPRNSRRLAERLQEEGASATVRIYPKAGHPDLVAALDGPFRGRLPVLADSVAFLREHSR